MKNPDVTVRMRGVMEKCSFCLQRIEQAKIAAKVKARDSATISVLSEKEGTVPKTACQQACPAEAIVFGDISDPNSTREPMEGQAAQLHRAGCSCTPSRACTYLAKVRNPNPGDAGLQGTSAPYSYDEYSKTMGRPALEESEPAEKGAANG